MNDWNIYRLEFGSDGLIAKQIIQVRAKNDTHALHIAIIELRIRDIQEQRRLCARDAAYDEWHRPSPKD